LLTDARTCVSWLLQPPIDLDRRWHRVSEPPSFDLLLEMLTAYAEIPKVGKKRFSGKQVEINRLWLSFRNFMRQGLSNFEAAQKVPNRSSSLLQYYAALNFAKAELLAPLGPGRLVDVFVGHGLSFNPTNAKTVAGDHLTVKNGVFKMLYEHRVGRPIAVGRLLPIRRLLSRLSEL
jgi:hypothetical protein